MWNWYEWESLQDFNAWHEAIKAELGLPRLSIDQRGEFCEPIVENYTSFIQIGSKFIAMVEDSYSQGLNVSELRPIEKRFDGYETKVI